MIATQHLEREILEELRVVMGNEFSSLLQTFIQDSTQRVAAVQREFATGNAVGLRAAAHSFKGSSSNMGAGQLAHICKQIEELALAGDVAGCAPLVRDIEAEFNAVKLDVEALLV
ncbi:MAG TPA: Hpt domain-containing protein [Spongiibacteraceae bacterium]|nr:Hpt domain-containing protein [Spongiibacteraceae bacterium]